MKTIIFTLLIGTILAVACASPSWTPLPQHHQNLQAVQQNLQKQAQRVSDFKKALSDLILQKLGKMQEDDDDDKLADAQIIRKIIRRVFG